MTAGQTRRATANRMFWAVMGDTISTPSALLTRAWPCQQRCSEHAQSGRHTRSWQRRREGASDERLAWGRHGVVYQSASDDKRRQVVMQGDARPTQTSDHNARVPLSQGVAQRMAQGDARPCEAGDDDAGGARPGQEPITRGTTEGTHGRRQRHKGIAWPG
ncbi:hypothetical protein BC826DRAFT_634446 [Russula brevipes]|nr:hypothetical protein BC826DRAFT_634446 [Russula brevipes]